MFLPYAEWPFRSMEARSLEETERWWEHCYLRGDAERILQAAPHWRIIAGGPGSGKSAAIEDLERIEQAKSLIVRYRPNRWPGSLQALARGGNHLAQIMALAGLAIRDYLTQHPDRLADLSGLQKGFMRWLLERYGGPRAFLRWLDGFEPDLKSHFQGITYEDLYNTIDSIDVQGQIDELANLARAFGRQRVLVTVDLNQPQATRYSESLAELFGWQDMMRHPGMALVAALPAETVRVARLIERARGRVSVVYLTWQAEQVREIALRHVRQAVADDVSLEELAGDTVWQAMETLLLEQYGDFAPAGWVALAETILYLAARKRQARKLPLRQADLPELKRLLFVRHFRLGIDANAKIVWRGPKLIKLTEQTTQFLAALQRRGDWRLNSDEDLIAVAGTRANVHSLASRTRKLIEPFPETPIYLLNRRGHGYWLENCANVEN